LCRRGFNRRLHLCFRPSAEADIVCVDAVSTVRPISVRGGGHRLCRRGFNRTSDLQSAEADIVCVDAVSTAVSIYYKPILFRVLRKG